MFSELETSECTAGRQPGRELASPGCPKDQGSLNKADLGTRDKGIGGKVASSVPRGIRHEGGPWSSWSMPEDSQVPSTVPPLCQEGPRVEPKE